MMKCTDVPKRGFWETTLAMSHSRLQCTACVSVSNQLEVPLVLGQQGLNVFGSLEDRLHV